jgi:hypothetical protein
MKLNANKYINCCILIGFVLTIIGSPVQVNAQDFNFTLPKVMQQNQVKDTQTLNSEVIFNDTLTLNDSLRFGWSNIDLSLDSRSNPSPNIGFIKAYITEVKDENFILDFATSPLKLDQLGFKLKEGKNKVIFVLYLDNKPTTKTINFTFNYKSTPADPIIKIIKPNQKTLFTTNLKQDFLINIENFVVKSGINLANHGKIKVYYNEVSDAGFLTQIIDSDNYSNGSQLKFNSDIFGDKFRSIPDSDNGKLIFVPITYDGKVFTTSQATMDVIMNYQTTLNIKSPSVEFLNINDSNNSILTSDKIKIKVNNFKLLKFDTRNSMAINEGYLQILVNDKPHKMTFDKTEFTIDELLPNYKEEKVNLRLQLVNTDFTALNPDTFATIDLFLKPNKVEDISTKVQASNWRLIIIGITVLLILGSVLYIIFRT